jgi:hypothetical protein
MSKAGTEGIMALLHERDIDHCALIALVAGMQDSLPDAIERLERVLDFNAEYRRTLSRRRRDQRKLIEINDRALDVGHSLLGGLRQLAEADAD